MAAPRVQRTVSKRKVVQRSLNFAVGKRVPLEKIAKPATRTVRPARSSELGSLRAVVINLKEREDRWQGLQRSAAKNAPWLKLERIDAVNGRETPPPKADVTTKWSTERLAKLFHWYRPKKIPMSPGERGCCASHLKAWRMCEKMQKPLLVLEDDAVVLPTFTKTLQQALREKPKDTGAIWITSKDRGTRKRVGKVLMEPTYVWTTVGYIIWPEAAKTFINLLPMDMPVDNFMAWHIKEGSVKTFSVSPAAVRQANTWNIGSDVPHSDDVAMWNYKE